MNQPILVSLVAIASATLSSTAAKAQSSAQDRASRTEAEVLPEALAEGERAPASYTLQPGNDTGTSIITEKEIRARTPGSGDVNELLKALPTVQFDRRQGMATREDIQDLRPADISISGGRIYENLITIDGVDASSRLDVTNDNPQHFAETAGNAAQTIWVDSSLVGAVTVRDSNVSAEYGRFTGGALDIKTRDPRRTFGMRANASYSADELVDFRVSQASLDKLGNGELPQRPNFEKWRFGASVDLPLSQDVALLVAANRSRAEVTYNKAAAYGGAPYGKSSVSDNFLVSGVADLAGTLTLKGKFTYSPYRSEASAENGANNLIVSHGGGIASQLELAEEGRTRWSLKAQYSHADSSRDAPPNNYSIPSSSTNGAVCSSTNCTIGGFGDVDQHQDTLALRFTAARDIGAGELRGGLDYQHVEALHRRPETNYAYSRGVSGRTIVCADGNSLLCTTGEYALQQYSEYRAYTAEVSLDSVAAWAEYAQRAGPVDLRAGLRYDHESYLGNHNFAPRLSATLDLPWEGWSLTAGANRYYGRSMLAYALRAAYPDNYIYRRNGVTAGGRTTYSDSGWYLYSVSRGTSYARSDLATPYSDELTGAVTGQVLGGTVRLKGVFRWSKDEFARSLSSRETGTLENGETTTYLSYRLTNDGNSRYRGGSIEWTRSFGKHSVAANVNYSKTLTSNSDYLASADAVEQDEVFYVYEGRVVSALEILEQNQRLEFASPFLANLTWTGLWFGDRLTTNLNLRYRNGFDQLVVNGRAVVDGVSYEAVERIRYTDTIDVNLNASVDVIRSRFGTLTADVRLANLLNRVPVRESALTTQPYQFGRSAWLGLAFRF